MTFRTKGFRVRDQTTRRAAVSALLGSAIEYYDFTLFATASALVLGPVFFAGVGTAQPTLAALLTFGLAFVARPLGAVVFGQFGDRVGRRPALVASVTLMGLATTAIGLVPGSKQWGLVAPLALVVLRFAQGLSAGGEQAGSNALTVEHAGPGERGALATWTMQGTTLGTLAGKLAFLAIVGLPLADQLAWGWRLPFLAAAPLLAVVLWIRSRLREPEIFVRARAARPAAGVGEVLRHHWRAVLVVAAGTLYAVGGAALNVYGLAWATGRKLVTADGYLWVLSGATLLGLLVQPVWGRASDRWGRRPVFVTAALATAALMFAFFATLATGSLPLFAVAAAALSLGWSGCNAVSASQFAELFPTPVRHTGAALGGQLGIIVAGFTPAIMDTLAAPGPSGWAGPAAFGAACLIAAGAASWVARETAREDLPVLDDQLRNGA